MTRPTFFNLMIKTCCRLALSTTALALLSSPCMAEILYGLTSFPSDALNRLDPVTGALESSTAIPGNPTLRHTLASNASGGLYSIGVLSTGVAQLIQIDPDTATITAAPGTLPSGWANGYDTLEFDPTNGLLYGAYSSGIPNPGGSLYVIDPVSGIASTGPTPISLSSGDRVEALAINSSGAAYLLAHNDPGSYSELYSLNLSTGGTSLIGEIYISQPFDDMAFNANDVLYANNESGEIYTLDLATAQRTYAFSAPNFGIAFTPSDVSSTPEPASFTLFGLGSLGLVVIGWRRRRRLAASAV